MIWLILMLIASLFLALGIGLAVTHSTRGCKTTEHDRRTRRVGIIIGAGAYCVTAVTMLLWMGSFVMLLGGILITPWLLYNARREKKLKQDPNQPHVCALCGYERPEHRDETNAQCPECGNDWWVIEHDSYQTKPLDGAMPRWMYRKREQSQRWAWILVPVFLLYIGAQQLPPITTMLPTPSLVWIANHGFGETRIDAIEAVLSDPNASRTQMDAMLDVAREIRDRPARLPGDIGNLIERGLIVGSFGDAAVDRFYHESFEITLEAVVSPDGTEVEPRVRITELANTIQMSPRVVSPGVRLDDGPFLQPVAGLVLPSWFAYAFEDYLMPSEDGSPYESHDRPDPTMYQGFRAVPVHELPPGEHTLSARVHLYVLQPNVVSIRHVFFNTAGTITPHPQSIWHETRDLTATFTVPEPTR